MKASWRSQAMCIGEDPSRWETANLNMFSADLEAKRLCAGCPVLDACLADAKKSFRVSDYTGIFDWGDALSTSGVVRGGQVFA